MVNKKFAIIVISIFTALLSLPMIVWGILGGIPGGQEVFEVDLEENRDPAKMPEKIDHATITADLEVYINDRLPFRSLIVYSYNKLSNSVEKSYKNTIRPALINLLYSAPSSDPTTDNTPDLDNELIMGGEKDTEDDVQNQGSGECQHQLIENIIQEATCLEAGEGEKICEKCDYSAKYILPSGHIGDVIKIVEPSYADYGYTLNKCTRCGGEYRTNIVNKLYYNTPFPLVLSGPNHDAQAIEGRDQWLFYSGNNSIEYYQGTNKLSKEQLESNTKILQELHEICEAKGKKLVVMILPNKEQVYSEYMPTLRTETGPKRTQLFVDHVKSNSDVNIIYPYEELMAAKPYWQVYSRLDTHWNAAGGFVGLQALYKALGRETTVMYDLPIIESLEKSLSNSDLINIGGYTKSDFDPDTDYDIRYKEDVTVSLTKTGKVYGYETQQIAITESDSPNQCNFVLLGDSFRKNMVRFLVKDFSNTLCTHRDKISNPDVIAAITEADVIVIQSVERIDMAVVNTAKTLIEILR